MPSSLELQELHVPGQHLPTLIEAPAERRLAPGLSRDRLRVVWTTPRGLTGAGGMDRLTQLVTQYMQAGNADFVPLTTKGRWSIIAGAFVFAYSLVRFALLAKGKGVDVLHINVAAFGSAYRKMILARLARWLGVPYVVHIHAGKFGPFWYGARPPIAAAVDRFLAQSAAIIVLGRDFARMVTDRLPTLQHKVRIVYNATPQRHGRARTPQRRGRFASPASACWGRGEDTAGLISALGKLATRSDWVATSPATARSRRRGPRRRASASPIASAFPAGSIRPRSGRCWRQRAYSRCLLSPKDCRWRSWRPSPTASRSWPRRSMPFRMWSSTRRMVSSFRSATWMRWRRRSRACWTTPICVERSAAKVFATTPSDLRSMRICSASAPFGRRLRPRHPRREPDRSVANLAPCHLRETAGLRRTSLIWMPVSRVVGEPIFALGRAVMDLTISVAATRCATVAVLKKMPAPA